MSDPRRLKSPYICTEDGPSRDLQPAVPGALREGRDTYNKTKKQRAKATKRKKRYTGRTSKNRGDTYEREIVHYLNASAFNRRRRARRAPLSGGGSSFLGGGDADITGTPLIYIECKRTNRLQVREALRQAEGNAAVTRAVEYPVVISRMDREPTHKSLCIMRLDAFVQLYRLAMAHLGYVEDLPAGVPSMKELQAWQESLDLSPIPELDELAKPHEGYADGEFPSAATLRQR